MYELGDLIVVCFHSKVVRAIKCYILVDVCGRWSFCISSYQNIIGIASCFCGCHVDLFCTLA